MPNVIGQVAAPEPPPGAVRRNPRLAVIGVGQPPDGNPRHGRFDGVAARDFILIGRRFAAGRAALDFVLPRLGDAKARVVRELRAGIADRRPERLLLWLLGPVIGACESIKSDGEFCICGAARSAEKCEIVSHDSVPFALLLVFNLGFRGGDRDGITCRSNLHGKCLSRAGEPKLVAVLRGDQHRLWICSDDRGSIGHDCGNVPAAIARVDTLPH